MSVIAWDGNTIAADKRASNDGFIGTTTKLFRTITGRVVGFVGTASQGLELMAWFEAGADPEKYPKFQTTDTWTRLIVADGCSCLVYETTPYPLTIEDKFCAFGSGRDFAISAMALGKTPSEAVRFAMVFDSNCGNGVTEFKLKEPA